MSLIKIISSEHSAEFGQLITDIKANVLSYLEARQKAQKERMIIIGKIAEYKSSYPQRSKEHRALTTAMNEEGWSQDVISNNLLAYKAMRGYLGGFFDKQFQPKFKSALGHNKGEVFEIPVNDGKFLIHQDSTDID